MLIFCVLFVVIDVDGTGKSLLLLQILMRLLVLLLLCWWFIVDMIWRSGQFVYSASIAACGLSPPPSWLDPRSPVYGVLPGNLLCLGTW